MDLKPVTSSNIKRVGYDADAKRLAVEFNNSGTYHYENVPPEAHEKLMARDGDGMGSHFHANIKGKFKHSLADA